MIDASERQIERVFSPAHQVRLVKRFRCHVRTLGYAMSERVVIYRDAPLWSVTLTKGDKGSEVRITGFGPGIYTVCDNLYSELKKRGVL